MRLVHKGEKLQEPLHYKECGLDDVYLLSGYERPDTPYGEGLAIKNADDLHKAVGCYLATQKKTLSNKELRFLRKQMNLTQTELGRIVGLSSQQVARWEKGEFDISGPAEILVRVLYVQHAGKQLDVEALVKSLDERDDPTGDEMYFEPTARGWKKAATG